MMTAAAVAATAMTLCATLQSCGAGGNGLPGPAVQWQRCNPAIVGTTQCVNNHVVPSQEVTK
jgi:hypothetical protein